MLDAAAELFYREGINATGVERLATESSVSKRTLYQHFPRQDSGSRRVPAPALATLPPIRCTSAAKPQSRRREADYWRCSRVLAPGQHRCGAVLFTMPP
ncbi:helix-turn-helix domain-containing protein [Mycobacterium kansasii]|uniref:helix-turn-helix domain-containing protein n=1 Tax=Mycobacterium kansasii TaxID=1768 RepID=UPI0034A0CACB